jgi:hypothetical protein
MPNTPAPTAVISTTNNEKKSRPNMRFPKKAIVVIDCQAEELDPGIGDTVGKLYALKVLCMQKVMILTLYAQHAHFSSSIRGMRPIHNLPGVGDARLIILHLLRIRGAKIEAHGPASGRKEALGVDQAWIAYARLARRT